MIGKTRDFLNNVIEQEEHIYIKSKKRSRVLIGEIPYKIFDIPEITQFDHFIECEVSPLTCPMRWEDLEIDFSDNNKRFCNHCEKYVYKANNITVVKKYKEQNLCMAITDDVLENINGKIEEEYYNKLFYRLEISKLFLNEKIYNAEEFQEWKDSKMSYKTILAKIIVNMLQDKSKIDFNIEDGINMKFILLAASYIKDDILKELEFSLKKLYNDHLIKDMKKSLIKFRDIINTNEDINQ